MPDKVAPVVADLLPYFAAGGHNAPALEFLSPVKGPILEQLTVEVGSGIREPAAAASSYDEDARKQALQLGLPGW
jgi:raffinose/stachyose/melibiose transport system substrate-binding protein